MGKTKKSEEQTVKRKGQPKYALLSPYFTYCETMNSKTSKSFINLSGQDGTLSHAINSLYKCHLDPQEP